MHNQSNKNSNNIISPIFDWDEILKSSPGEILFQKIESRLPYVGKKQKNGWVESPAYTLHQSIDYSSFKGGSYQSEALCASVILGINGINSLCRNCTGTIFDFNMPDWDLKDDSNKIQIACSERVKIKKVSSSEIEEVQFSDEELKTLIPSKREIYAYHTLKVVLNLRDMMRLGVRTGEVAVDKDPEEYSSPISHEPGYLFFTDVYYEVWSFFEWMQNNFYKIPEELKYHKNHQTGFEYVDTIKYNNMEQTFPKHPTGKTLTQDPLYIAVKARQAFIKNNIPMPNSALGKRYYIHKWVKANFSDMKWTDAKLKEISALVNDGAGHGGNRK